MTIIILPIAILCVFIAIGIMAVRRLGEIKRMLHYWYKDHLQTNRPLDPSSTFECIQCDGKINRDWPTCPHCLKEIDWSEILRRHGRK